MKVTDYIVEFLQRKGIHDFFGYQGTMIAHLVDSIEKNPHTRSHSSYHEQGNGVHVLMRPAARVLRI